jgi:hypothetical protein
MRVESPIKQAILDGGILPLWRKRKSGKDFRFEGVSARNRFSNA